VDSGHGSKKNSKKFAGLEYLGQKYIFAP